MSRKGGGIGCPIPQNNLKFRQNFDLFCFLIFRGILLIGRFGGRSKRKKSDTKKCYLVLKP